MKIKLNTTQFTDALQRVIGITGSRNIHPILNNIILETEPTIRQMKLYMTDFDVWVTDYVNVEIADPGSIGINAAKLLSLCKELKGKQDGIVIEETDPGIIQLTCGRSKYNMPGINIEDYPVIDKPKPKTSFAVPATELSTMLAKTSFAVDDKTPDTKFKGVNMVLADSTLKIVGFQHSRLAMIEKPCTTKTNAPETCGVVVPKKVASELSRLLKGISQDIKIDLGENKITFHVQNMTIISSILEAQPFDYDKSKFKDALGVYKFDTQDLHNAIKRASLFGADATIDLMFEDTELSIRATHHEHGTAEEKVNIIESKSQQEHNCVSSASNITEFLRVAGDEIEIHTFQEPFLMLKDLADPDYFYVSTLIVG